MAANNEKLHIVMLPWLAFGHMIPYLELSKLIAQKGHKVSFISTPKNIDRLPKLHPTLSSLIDFVKLPMTRLNNLPENAEATIDVPLDKVKYLKLAFDGLQEPLAKFLEEASPTPDCILYDFTTYWLAPIASKYNLSTAYFCIFTAPFLGFMGPTAVMSGDGKTRTKPEDFLSSPKWVPFESTVAFRLFEIKRIFSGSVTGDEEHVSDMFRLAAALENCDFIAVRSCYEFESDWLKVVQEIHGKPVLPVGQLPTTTYDNGDDSKDLAWRGIKQWFDKQAKGSVVYIAFGSEAKPSQDELNEIALGLELFGLPFFWVLRTRRGEADTEVIELPNGFEERTKGQGIVCTSWAPQLKILSHDSVGGCLTHSGWSSVVEAIQFERPLILLTFLADQGINAKVLEEKKMGYLIPRNEEDGSFTRHDVAKSINMVIFDEEGRIYREKIKEMKGIFCDLARQDFYVENLLSNLQNHRRGRRDEEGVNEP